MMNIIEKEYVKDTLVSYSETETISNLIYNYLKYLATCMYHEFKSSEVYSRALGLNIEDNITITLNDFDSDLDDIGLINTEIQVKDGIIFVRFYFDNSILVWDVDTFARKFMDIYNDYSKRYKGINILSYPLNIKLCIIEDKTVSSVNVYMWRLFNYCRLKTECLQSDTNCLCVKLMDFKKLCKYNCKFNVDTIVIISDLDSQYMNLSFYDMIISYLEKHVEQNIVLVYDLLIDANGDAILSFKYVSIYVRNFLERLYEAVKTKDKVCNLSLYYNFEDTVVRLEDDYDESLHKTLDKLNEKGINLLNSYEIFE